jgi:hypothetical protein
MLSHLTAVGKDKPLGYIPIESLNSYYKVNVDKLKLLLETEEDVYDVIALTFGANYLLEAKYS